MVRRATKVGPWRAVVFLVLGMVGFVFMTAEAASAAGPVGRFVTFSFSSDRVTITLPSQGCPSSHPDCQWMLFVNEPATGAVVGTATGTSGTLTIAYPRDFCGVIQADALIGPAPWRSKVGHQRTIQTAASCSPAQLPFNGGNRALRTEAGTAALASAGNPSQLPFDGNLTQLPFTGMDVKPLTILGVTLTMLGILLVTDFEQRRRTMRLTAASAKRATSVAGRWFFGN